VEDAFGFASALFGLSLFIIVPIWAAAGTPTTFWRKVGLAAGGIVAGVLFLAIMAWLMTR
jgi:hypothetical protein